MKNDVTLHDGCAIIHIVLPDGRRRDAIVDAEDLPLVARHTWAAKRNQGNAIDAPSAYYVAAGAHRDGRPTTIRLHRLVTETLEAGRWVQVQHLNEDTFDNRKSNLLVGSQFQNTQLQRGHVATGASFDPVRGQYLARITYAGKSRYLGRYPTLEAAQAAYDPFRRARLADPSDHLPWAEFKAKVMA